jgi:hypothetical protein
VSVIPTAISGGSVSNVAIGVGVGVPLGILAMAMLGVRLWWGRRERRMAVRTEEGERRRC